MIFYPLWYINEPYITNEKSTGGLVSLCYYNSNYVEFKHPRPTICQHILAGVVVGKGWSSYHMVWCNSPTLSEGKDSFVIDCCWYPTLNQFLVYASPIYAIAPPMKWYPHRLELRFEPPKSITKFHNNWLYFLDNTNEFSDNRIRLEANFLSVFYVPLKKSDKKQQYVQDPVSYIPGLDKDLEQTPGVKL